MCILTLPIFLLTSAARCSEYCKICRYEQFPRARSGDCLWFEYSAATEIWLLVAGHSLAASSLWTASAMANSLLKCADQIAGISLVMLRRTVLLVFLHKLRFCTCREVCHKSYAVDYVKLEEIPATRAVESFSNSLPVNTQICCFEEAPPERRTYWSKKGWEKCLTKTKTATMEAKALLQLTSPCSGE